MIKLKDIELGKPDAKDEVLYSESLGEFCNKIILPPGFEIGNLISKDKCYIVGNKGVGKTALLFYINNLLLEEDPNSECSMILFKTQISASTRARMDKIERIRISNMNISNDELEYVRDFTRLWTLVIYKKIVEDNKEGKIFERDTNWTSFENIVNRLDGAQADVLRFANHIPDDQIYYDANYSAYIGNYSRVEYPKDVSDHSLACFYDAIEFADKLFCSLKKYEHKYYICIDELEAYNSKRDVYLRDLAMIRDLIITTKRLNALLRLHKQKNIKIILSVRSEMVRSISREIPGLEYNKDLEGFAERINWSGPKVDFIYHPLTSIWLKRLQESLNKQGNTLSISEIYKQMFPEIIGLDTISDFVIDRTWQKPRDIIRFMSCLHKVLDVNAHYYEAKDFAKAIAEYSRQSKEEIVEELGAIYESVEIDQIFKCLTAYKKFFTKEELVARLESAMQSHNHTLNANKIVDDLYRIGVIGLVNFDTESELWGYLGQAALEDKNIKYMIHRGLWSILELEKEAFEGILFTDIVGNPFECNVKGRDENYLRLTFNYHEKTLNGIIHVKDISRNYVNLNSYIGEKIHAVVTGYNRRRKMWQFSVLIMEKFK